MLGNDYERDDAWTKIDEFFDKWTPWFALFAALYFASHLIAWAVR